MLGLRPAGAQAPALLVQRGQRDALFGLQLRVSCSHYSNLPQVEVLHFGVEIAKTFDIDRLRQKR